MNSILNFRKKSRRTRVGIVLVLGLILVSILIGAGLTNRVLAQDKDIFLPFLSDGSSSARTTPSTLPEVNVSKDGTISVNIPEHDAPTVSSRSVLSVGNGPTAVSNSQVNIHWEMFSWSTGARVESSRDAGEDAVSMELDVSTMPTFLIQSIIGATAGSRLLVVFEKGMADLPSHLDQNDAYVLVVDVLGVDGIEVLASVVDGIALGAERNQKAKFSGRAWHDVNGDSKRQNTEAWLSGIGVRLIDSEGNIVNQTTTNSKGYYRLLGEPNAYHQIQFDLSSGYNAFSPTPNAVRESRDSDVSPDTGLTVDRFIAPENTKIYDIDAGLVISGSVLPPTAVPPSTVPPSTVPPTAVPTAEVLPLSVDLNTSCQLIASTGSTFEFGYQDVPANMVVSRNGGGIQTISGNGLFRDTPDGAAGTTYQYSILSDGQTIADCGDVTIPLVEQTPPILLCTVSTSMRNVFLVTQNAVADTYNLYFYNNNQLVGSFNSNQNIAAIPGGSETVIVFAYTLENSPAFTSISIRAVNEGQEPSQAQRCILGGI